MSKLKKPKTLRPQMPIVTPITTNNSDANAQFELELCWCVQQLETALNSGKLTPKVAEDTIKNLKILKGNSAPLIKKRQVMKAAMGDYRAKMKEEEKKMNLASKQLKFIPTAETNKKSSFVKKSVILTSGKDFKFNFNTTANTEENQTNKEHDENQENTTDCSHFKTTNLRLTSGSEFKFNFVIEEHNNKINFDQLSIK